MIINIIISTAVAPTTMPIGDNDDDDDGWPTWSGGAISEAQ